MKIMDNGNVRPMNEAEIIEHETMLEISVEEQIEQLKSELCRFDYIGVKIAMGVGTKEEYSQQIAYTETLREKIRDLEQSVKNS